MIKLKHNQSDTISLFRNNDKWIKIIKYDTENPNFKQTPKPEPEVNGNQVVDGKKSPYEEGKYYAKNESGNLEFFSFYESEAFVSLLNLPAMVKPP